jgi:hypothetical protein
MALKAVTLKQGVDLVINRNIPEVPITVQFSFKLAANHLPDFMG